MPLLMETSAFGEEGEEAGVLFNSAIYSVSIS